MCIIERRIRVIAFGTERHNGPRRPGSVDEVQRCAEQARQRIRQGKPLLVRSAIPQLATAVHLLPQL